MLGNQLCSGTFTRMESIYVWEIVGGSADSCRYMFTHVECIYVWEMGGSADCCRYMLTWVEYIYDWEMGVQLTIVGTSLPVWKADSSR